MLLSLNIKICEDISQKISIWCTIIRCEIYAIISHFPQAADSLSKVILNRDNIRNTRNIYREIASKYFKRFLNSKIVQ